MTHDEMIEVIAAHRDGEKVQCNVKSNCFGDGGWVLINQNHDFDFHSFDYRIQPDPIVAYALVSADGVYTLTFSEKSAKNHAAKHNLRVVTLTEKTND